MSVRLEGIGELERIADCGHTVVFRARRDDGDDRILVRAIRSQEITPARLRCLDREFSAAQRVGDAIAIVPTERVETAEAHALVYPDVRLLSEEMSTSFTIDEALTFGVALSSQLHALHELGLLHLGLCPAAICFNRSTGWLRLTGFSAASPVDVPSSSQLEVCTTASNLPYIAPEQSGRLDRAPDRSTDLYALGLLLYEVVTGARVFESDDPLEWIHWHLAGAPKPPDEVNPAVPGQLSNIILKLLAKQPEDRYKTASGLRHDVARCLEMWRAGQASHAFALATRDFVTRFELPDRLYGREQQLAALERIWQGPPRGRSRIAMLTGPAGAGKSALANEFGRRRQARIVRGKFEQLRQNAPYGAIVQAIETLARELLSDDDEYLHQVRESLRASLGNSIAALVDLSPALRPVLGQYDPPPIFGPHENRNRLNTALRSLLARVATQERPMVLILDDLQWADDASLELLGAVLPGADLEHLLLLGCYRDNEVGEEHPLRELLSDLRAKGSAVDEIAVGPLSIEQVTPLVADALQQSAADAKELAAHLYRRAEGNPYDTRQLMRVLASQGDIEADSTRGCWRWAGPRRDDLGEVVDVVSLITPTIEDLPVPTRRLVEIGMCMGNRFSLASLATICDEAADVLRSRIEPAVTARVLTVDGDVYGFSHDRVQQAVSALTPAATKAEHHGLIGWQLYQEAQVAPQLLDEQLFTIADHLNRASAAPSSRRILVEINLAACRKAAAANAYSTASLYGETARTLLSALDSGTGPSRLAFDVYLELARARYLSGAFPEAKTAIDDALPFAGCFGDRATVYALRKDVLVSEGEKDGYREAVQRGLDVVEEMLPEFVAGCRDEGVVDREIAAIESLLEGREPAELLQLPRLTAPDHAALMHLLMNVWEAAYYAGDEAVMQVTVPRLVRTSLEHGNATESAMGYVLFGNLLLARGDLTAAFEYGKLGLTLNERFDDRVQLPKVTNLFCNYINYLHRPFANSVDLYELSARIGRENGDFLFGLWAAFFVVWTRFLSSDDLATVHGRASELQGFVEQTRDEKMVRAFRLLQWTIAELMDPAQHKFGDHREAEQATLEYWRDNGFLPGPTWHAILRAQAAYLYGHPRTAFELLMDEELVLAPEIVMFPLSQLYFYRGASAAALWDEAAAAERERLTSVLDNSLARLGELAETCPANFAYQLHLLEAERLRIDGAPWEASEAYERAIECADEYGPIFARALCCESTGAFWHRAGRSAFARAYFERALAAYSDWGARSKVEELRWRLGALLAPEDRETVQPPSSGERSEPSRHYFDLQSLRKATQVVAGQTRLDQLLTRTLQVVLENAGAERGVLLVREQNDFRVRVTASLKDTLTTEVVDTPLEESNDLPIRVLRQVARTRQAVVSGDAHLDRDLCTSPYIEANAVRSMQCVPGVYAGSVTALLYLENNLAADVFSGQGRDVLQIVLSQLAIALDSVRLYQELLKEVEERRLAEAALAASDFRLRRSHHFANIGVWDWNVQTGELFWSDRIGPLFGYPEGELRTSYENFIEAVHPDDRAKVETAIQDCFDGEDYRVDHRIVRPDGAVRWMSESGDVLRDETGKPVRMLGVVQDITERVENEEERRRLTHQLQQAQKMEAIGQLTGGIAHDFNNILGVTVGFAEIAMDACEKGVYTSLPASLQHILDSSLRAKALVEQLLSFSRAKRSRPQRLDLAAEVEQNLHLLAATLPATLQLSLNASPDLPAVLADPVDLNQILMNCCINAHHAMGGRGHLEIRMSVMDRPGVVCSSCHETLLGTFVEVSIEDSGHGIEEEILDRIFEPFFTTKKTGEGTGMGLAMVHGVIHRLNGHVVVNSQLGQGTVVQLLLPAAGREAIDTALDGGGIHAMSDVRARVLVVDDERPLAELYGMVLASAGCKVSVYSEPAQALSAFEAASDEFDLVLTDLTMPKMTGLELARRVRGRCPDVPILLCTGNVDALAPDATHEVHEVLQKPVRKATLLAALARVLPVALT